MIARPAYLCGLVVFVAAAWALASPSCAQSTVLRPLVPELVPSGEIPARTKGLLPIRRTEFQQLLREHRAGDVPWASDQLKIDRAVYFARFADGQLLDGRARWLLDSRMAAADLPFPPHKLPLERLPAIEVESESATGSTPPADLPTAAALELAWTLSPSRTNGQRFEFSFFLPRSLISQLILQLPRGWTIESTGGLRSRFDASSPDTFVRQIIPRSAGDDRWWLLELGSQTKFEITIAQQSSVPRTTRLRQIDRYRLHENGIELQTRLLLDAQAGQSSLAISVLGPLRIASARMGETQLTIHEQPGLDEVLLDSPGGLLSGQREVEISAVAPLEFAAFFRLPTLRVANVSWQQGTVLLEVPVELELMKLELDGYLETGVGPLPSPQSGELLELQAFREDAALGVVVEYREPRLQLKTAASLRVAEGFVTAREVSFATTDRGNLFEIRLAGPTEWDIDSIETEPADALEGITTSDGGEREYRLSLRKPINADTPLKIIVQAHRQVGRGRLEGHELRPIRFVNAASSSRYVSLSADGSLQIRLVDDAFVRRVDESELPDEIRGLAEWTPGLVAFLDDPDFLTFGVQVDRRSARYGVRVDVTAIVEPGSLQQRFTLRCEPQDGAISLVQVRLSKKSTAPIDWSLVGESEGIVSPRRLPPAEGEAGELFEISLRSARVDPFTLQGTRREALELPMGVALASAPQADSQTGTLTIAAADGQSLTVRGPSLRSTLPPDDPAADLPAARSHYRYEPADAGEIIVAPIGFGGPAAVWVWRCQVDSWVDESGFAIHHANLDVENLGARQTTITFPGMPTGVRIQRVAVDGQELPLTNAILPQHSIDIPLARQRRASRIQIEYGSDGPRLGVMAEIETPWPQLEIPCLQRTWRVWLAPGYAPLRSLNRGLARTAELAWYERLLGSSLVRGDSRPFDFSSWNDWRRTFTWPPGSRESPAVFVDDFRSIAAAADSAEIPAVGDGWSRYVIDLDAEQSARLAIIRNSVASSLAWALMLVTIGLIVWLLPNRKRGLPYLLIISAGATLLAPADLLIFVRSVFLGSAAATIYLVIGGRRFRPAAAAQSGEAPWADALLPVLLICWGAGLGSGRAVGQELPAAAPQATEFQDSDETQRVLIPVDDEYRPIGDIIYLAPSLFDRLHGGPAAGAGVSIESARYEVGLAYRSNTFELQVANVIATYQLDNGRRGARLALPFSRESSQQLAATLDGRSVEPIWRGDRLEIEVPVRGRSRLEFRIAIAAERGRSTSRLLLPIPLVADSRLIVRSPADAHGIEIRSCLGAQFTADTGDLRRADLGPTAQIDVRWPNDQAQWRAEVAAETLHWLTVRPDSAVLDVSCRFSVASGELATLSLTADRQLIPQRMQLDDTDVEYSVEPGERQRIDLTLPQPYAAGSQGLIRARFAVPNFRGWGMLKVPRIALTTATTNADWLAASVPAYLSVRVVPDTELQRVGEQELSALWPVSYGTPRVAYRLPLADARFELEIQPLPPDVSHEQEAVITVGRRFARVHSRTLIAVATGHLLRQRVTLPAEMRVDSVTARNAAGNRLRRWSLDRKPGNGGQLALFFREPVNDQITVDIQGTVPIAPGEPLAVPQVRFQGSAGVRQLTHFYRRPEVRFDDLGELHQTTEPEWTSRLEAGRYVGSLSELDQAPARALTVKENRPLVHAELTTHLRYLDGSWRVQVDIDLTPKGGLIDQIRLRVPSEWSSDIEVAPPLQNEMSEVAGFGGKVLTLTPPQAVSTPYHVELKAELSYSVNQDFLAPDITVLDAAAVERYMALPSNINRQDLERSGLEFLRQVDGETAIYKVVRPSMRAVLRDTNSPARPANVRLADYYLSWKPGGLCRGVASFDVEPGRQSHCTLLLPTGYSLVHATVGGVPATIAPDGSRRWRIRFDSDQLPQRVMVLFAGRLPDRQAPLGGQLLLAPSLQGLPVERTLWTVDSPPRGEALQLLLEHTQVPPSEQVRIRLETVRELLQLSSSDVGSPSEYDLWRRRWLERQARYQLLTGGSASAAADERDVASSLFTPASEESDLVDKWLTRLQHDRLLHCSLRGEAASLIVTSPDSVVRRFVITAGILSALFAFAALAWFYFRTSFCREWLVRWPHAMGVFAGLMLWVVVAPGVVGWLLVVLFAVSALRPLWAELSPR